MRVPPVCDADGALLPWAHDLVVRYARALRRGDGASAASIRRAVEARAEMDPVLDVIKDIDAEPDLVEHWGAEG